MNLARLLLTAIVLLWLTGCAGGRDTPSLFVLDQNPGRAPADQTTKPGQPTLVIQAVDTAPYLNDGGIVYQTGPHRVVVANNNRWASPLAGQLTDGLYATLGAKLDRIDVQEYSASHTGKAIYRLTTRVDAFFGHYDGSARIAGQWTLSAPDGNPIAQRPFNRRIPLAANGYPALVTSLARGWRQTTTAIAAAVIHTLHSHRKATATR